MKYASTYNGRVYVKTKRTWAKEYDALVVARDLTEARRHHGRTRELHTYVSVRRATWDDVERLGGLGNVEDGS